MITKRIFRCTHCNGIAREYFGVEGGKYIGKTPFECASSPDGEHNFQPSNEPIPANEKPSIERMMDFFGGVGAKVNVAHQPGDMFNHNFTGTIKGIHGEFITVEDQDGDAWDCSPYQLTFNSDAYMHE